ncbi:MULTISPECIES: hypothetical protein [Burkholderia]|uniref:hypothetical protein n=1 Tax=Burkholderia TaxID=32008 RepID=UPI00103F2ADB|nr:MULTISPECIES: hypothetical protein [Burkholderia]
MSKFYTGDMMRRMLTQRALSLLCCNVLLLSLLFVAEGAKAFTLITSDVLWSYKSCSWTNNGDGTSKINVSMEFKTAPDKIGLGIWTARGILIYTYDENGKILPSSRAAKSITLNGVSSDQIYRGDDYFIYYGLKGDWKKQSYLVAEVEVIIDNSVIAKWPGIGVRAGAYTTKADVGEVTGAAYLSKMGTSKCDLLEPTLPPPPPPAAITVDVAAPDWNLGELPRGEGEKTLSGLTEQLCFTYSGVNSSRQFVIDAKGENGTSGGTFFLKNVTNAAQKIPYKVTLDSGVDKFTVPNGSGSPVSLNNGNRTCFVPTFKTSVGMSVDVGNYSDILTFTIVTKT